MMLFFSYISFLIKSIHLHGVHSPFVFNLINNGLRSKEKIKFDSYKTEISSGQYKLFKKLIRYFDAKSILVDDKNLQKHLQQTLQGAIVRTELPSEEEKIDLLFFKKTPENTSIDSFLGYMHNDSVLIINNIRSKENHLFWEQLVHHPKTTACIDVFVQGYIFVRKEQKKELFYIKV